jgi:hypothetical protein
VFDKLTREDFLALFGIDSQLKESLALADSQETLELATYLVGRSRYSC